MASGFVTAAGLDLDSVFAPWHAGWPQAGLTDFDVSGGADLNTRYATLATGSAAAATKFILSSGADLDTIFAALGTTNVQVATQPSAVSGSAAAGTPSGTVTSNTTSCAGAKGRGSYTYTWHIANGSGFTLTTPNSQTCGITGNIPAAQSVSGGIYCAISDGTTTVNTRTVACSLTNTSPPTWNFSITAGVYATVIIGYYPQHSTGSITGGTLGALSITYLADNTNAPDIAFSIGGFTSDPGQNSLTTLVTNGHTLHGSSAIYSFQSGTAQWIWDGTIAGFVNGDTYSAVLTASFT